MPHIIRSVRQAGVYFVTSRTWNSRALFAKPEVAQILLDQLLDCRQRGFYKLHPFVIMPDLIWQEGFHDRWIRDESEFQERAAYIRSNRVTAKLATVPEEYVFCSASGRYPLDTSQYEKSTSGAEAPISEGESYVAVKTATYKDSPRAKANPTHKA